VSCRYLQEVSNRLFSEGLHTFGREPSSEDLFKYMNAYLEGRLPDDVIQLVCDTSPSQLDSLPSKIMRDYGKELQHMGASQKMNGACDKGCKFQMKKARCVTCGLLRAFNYPLS
jgi:cobalamin biosynthesis Mg chelatase CobN